MGIGKLLPYLGMSVQNITSRRTHPGMAWTGLPPSLYSTKPENEKKPKPVIKRRKNNKVANKSRKGNRRKHHD